MDFIRYEFYGEGYDEKIIIKYLDFVIYDNYVDNLVTSVSSEIELNLRFKGSSMLSPVIVKLINSQVILIPKYPECFSCDYRYISIFFSQEKFREIWTAMRYDADIDIARLNQITYDEIILLWLISSNCRSTVNSTKDYQKYIKSKILCASLEDNLLEDLIDKLLDNRLDKLIIQKSIIEKTDRMKEIYLYLDQELNSEWNAFFMDNEKNIYLHIGNGSCILINTQENI